MCIYELLSSIKRQDPLTKESYSYLKISCVSSGDANVPPDPEIQHETLRRCSLVFIKKNLITISFNNFRNSFGNQKIH